MTDPQAWLSAATIDDAVSALRPDYRAVLLTADGLRGGDSDEVGERIVAAAEATPGARIDAVQSVTPMQGLARLQEVARAGSRADLVQVLTGQVAFPTSDVASFAIDSQPLVGGGYAAH